MVQAFPRPADTTAVGSSSTSMVCPSAPYRLAPHANPLNKQTVQLAAGDYGVPDGWMTRNRVLHVAEQDVRGLLKGKDLCRIADVTDRTSIMIQMTEGAGRQGFYVGGSAHFVMKTVNPTVFIDLITYNGVVLSSDPY